MRATLELSPRENHRRKHRQFSSNPLFDAKGGMNIIWPSGEKMQVSFHAEVGSEGSREPASEFVIQDLGHAEAGWKPLPEGLNETCANSEAVFRAFFDPEKKRNRTLTAQKLL